VDAKHYTILDEKNGSIFPAKVQGIDETFLVKNFWMCANFLLVKNIISSFLVTPGSVTGSRHPQTLLPTILLERSQN